MVAEGAAALAMVASVVDPPKAACRIGTAACPTSPWLPKLLLVALVRRAIARLFAAIANSLANPFSIVLTSFRSYCRHSSIPRLPV